MLLIHIKSGMICDIRVHKQGDFPSAQCIQFKLVIKQNRLEKTQFNGSAWVICLFIIFLQLQESTF